MGGALKDSQLALFIASHPNQNLYDKHHQKINALIWMMLIQSLFITLHGLGISSKMEPTVTWGIAALLDLTPLLFAYGFYKNYAFAFNAYLVLNTIQILIMFAGFNHTPITMTFVSLAIMLYALYVRTLLFPDFFLILPKKINDQYIFSN